MPTRIRLKLAASRKDYYPVLLIAFDLVVYPKCGLLESINSSNRSPHWRKHLMGFTLSFYLTSFYSLFSIHDECLIFWTYCVEALYFGWYNRTNLELVAQINNISPSSSILIDSTIVIQYSHKSSIDLAVDRNCSGLVVMAFLRSKFFHLQKFFSSPVISVFSWNMSFASHFGHKPIDSICDNPLPIV